MTNALALNTIFRLHAVQRDAYVQRQTLVQDIKRYYGGLLDDLKSMVLENGTLNQLRAASLERAGFPVFRHEGRWTVRTTKGNIVLM